VEKKQMKETETPWQTRIGGWGLAFDRKCHVIRIKEYVQNFSKFQLAMSEGVVVLVLSGRRRAAFDALSSSN
jgi:hypothetical protein